LEREGRVGKSVGRKWEEKGANGNEMQGEKPERTVLKLWLE